MPQKKYEIIPNEGYILVTPYAPSDETFESIRERVGEAIISEVLAIGNSVVDEDGIVHVSPHGVGDIIVHAYNSKDFEIGFTKYRMVHFTECYGSVLKKEDKIN